MCAQRSNRAELIEGTLRCLERLPLDRITTRAIAQESAANQASITYHFGSKDALITEAVIEGLDRWLGEVGRALTDVVGEDAPTRFRRAAEAVESSRQRHVGLVKNLVSALARAQYDTRVRDRLAAGFHRTRPNLAGLLGLGEDDAARDAAGLVLALFCGLLIQDLLDPSLAITGVRMERAQARLAELLPRTSQPASEPGSRRDR